jgi:hypothetical protein
MRALKAGLLYCALVFGAGFILGSIRLALVVPRLGVRASELLEIPIMLATTVMAARWVVRRLAVPPVVRNRLGMGLIALVLMLLAEFGLVLSLRGMSFREYLATRDPVSAAVYYASLVVFALMPLILRLIRAGA